MTSDGPAEANAALIAAAPDLFAACESALRDAEAGEPSDGRTIDRLKAALKLARGEKQ